MMTITTAFTPLLSRRDMGRLVWISKDRNVSIHERTLAIKTLCNQIDEKVRSRMKKKNR